MWGLLVAAVEEALNKKEQLKLPKGVSVIKARLDREHYIFRVETEDGQYVYS